MYHHATVSALVALTGIITMGSYAPATRAGFHGISDDGSERVETTYPCGAKRQCKVSRVIVQRPNYDGPPGYTAILVVSERFPGPGVWREEFAVFPRGQYRLLGVDPEEHRVLGYQTAQRGATIAIVNLVAFDPSRQDGEIIGPKDGYQYVSCGADGRYCILVDSGVTMVAMDSGESRVISSHEQIPPEAADPPHATDHGYSIGGGYSVSDEHVEMVWAGSSSGTLLIRNPAGELVMKIAVAWQAGG